MAGGQPLSPPPRAVILLDCDSFYVQSVVLRYGLQASTAPIGVVQQNIIVTSCYRARGLGVEKLMLTTRALELCPELQLYPGEDLTPFRAASLRILRTIRTELEETGERLLQWEDESGQEVCSPGAAAPRDTLSRPSTTARTPKAASAPLPAHCPVERQVLEEYFLDCTALLEAIYQAAARKQWRGVMEAGLLGQEAVCEGEVATAASPAAPVSVPGHCWTPSKALHLSSSSSSAAVAGHQCRLLEDRLLWQGKASSNASSTQSSHSTSSTCIFAEAAGFILQSQRVALSSTSMGTQAGAAGAATSRCSCAFCSHPALQQPPAAASSLHHSAAAAANIRQCPSCWQTALLCLGSVLALRLRQRVMAETGFTTSAGVCSSKLGAKLAAGLHKPDDQTVLLPALLPLFLLDKPVQVLPGVGSTTGKKLMAEGIVTVRQLLKVPRPLLSKFLSQGIPLLPALQHHTGVSKATMGPERGAGEGGAGGSAAGAGTIKKEAAAPLRASLSFAAALKEPDYWGEAEAEVGGRAAAGAADGKEEGGAAQAASRSSSSSSSSSGIGGNATVLESSFPSDHEGHSWDAEEPAEGGAEEEEPDSRQSAAASEDEGEEQREHLEHRHTSQQHSNKQQLQLQQHMHAALAPSAHPPSSLATATRGEMSEASADVLSERILSLAAGIDSAPVQDFFAPQSISDEQTFYPGLRSWPEALQEIEQLAVALVNRWDMERPFYSCRDTTGRSSSSSSSSSRTAGGLADRKGKMFRWLPQSLRLSVRLTSPVGSSSSSGAAGGYVRRNGVHYQRSSRSCQVPRAMGLIGRAAEDEEEDQEEEQDEEEGEGEGGAMATAPRSRVSSRGSGAAAATSFWSPEAAAAAAFPFLCRLFAKLIDCKAADTLFLRLEARSWRPTASVMPGGGAAAGAGRAMLGAGSTSARKQLPTVRGAQLCQQLCAAESGFAPIFQQPLLKLPRALTLINVAFTGFPVPGGSSSSSGGGDGGVGSDTAAAGSASITSFFSRAVTVPSSVSAAAASVSASSTAAASSHATGKDKGKLGHFWKMQQQKLPTAAAAAPSSSEAIDLVEEEEEGEREVAEERRDGSGGTLDEDDVELLKEEEGATATAAAAAARTATGVNESLSGGKRSRSSEPASLGAAQDASVRSSLPPSFSFSSSSNAASGGSKKSVDISSWAKAAGGGSSGTTTKSSSSSAELTGSKKQRAEHGLQRFLKKEGRLDSSASASSSNSKGQDDGMDADRRGYVKEQGPPSRGVGGEPIVLDDD